MNKTLSLIKSVFLNGLALILPITLTIGLFVYSFKVLIRGLQPLHKIIPKSIEIIPHSEILLGIIIIFLAGILFKFIILRSLFDTIESYVFSLPLVKTIYFGLKQLIKAFTIQDQMSFKRVVLVEYPRKGLYSIGFLTCELPKEISPRQDKVFYNIYIASTPNPATGYFLMLSEEEILPTSLSRQEAMALIISGGIVKPEKYNVPSPK